ncbi:MAG: DUF4132 domain-containing protein [Propionibacteriaceae bacterium]|nr:DUF4132 domain-containing protein [Micropruina sp.]HBX82958.1 hypothetical protein [Propionibacteriaceae bacterium]HBY22241.1 hypothetical protein [Propionibacteriaceae bacterium]
MFERLKAAFQGATGAATGDRRAASKPSKELRQALRPIEAVSPELYERCVAYVHDGSGPEVLLELTAAPNRILDEALLRPGMSSNAWIFNEDLKAKLTALGYPYAQADAIREARATYYASNAPLEAYARLGRLFTCIGEAPNRQVDGVPPWLVALLNDLGATCAHHQSLAAEQPAWTPARVSALARLAEDIAEDDLPKVVFWALMSVSDSSYIPQPRALPGVDAFLIEAGPLLPADAAQRFDVSSRVDLAERHCKDPRVAVALAPLLATMSCDKAKTVRVAAIEALGHVPEPVLAQVMPPALAKVPASQASEITEMLTQSEVGRELLAQAVARGGKIALAVEKAEARRTAMAQPPADAVTWTIPPFTPEPEADTTEAIIAELRRGLDRVIAAGVDATNKYTIENAAKARKVSEAELREFADVAHGRRTNRPKLLERYNLWWLADQAPSLGLAAVLRLASTEGNAHRMTWVARQRISEDTDPRAIEVAVSRAGVPPESVDIAEMVRPSTWNHISPEAAWPWYATRLNLLATWLTHSAASAVDAIVILEAFPSLPTQVLPGLAAVASGDSRTARHLAQALLARHGLARALAVDALADGKGEIRAAAAAWLAAVGDPTTITDLRAALKKEKREVARAAMLAALESLGDDISADLAPATLLAEATTGLKAKVTPALAWLNLDQLPATSWADGSPVDPQIIRWWVVLADKLKTSDGSGLIDRYLSLLDADSAATLGRFALTTWITRDTAPPREEDSRAYAAPYGPRRWQAAQDRVKRIQKDPYYSRYLAEAQAEAAKSVEQHVQEAFNEHQATYLASASANRGLLALTTRMPGIEVANAVQSYIRNHGGRRAQVDALMYPLYANGQPACIQLLLGISRRFKQVSVQETAGRLVQALADQRGWTSDELADRTIPTAGFEDDRLLHLSFGEREFIGRATTDGTIELSTADGKPIKSLPAAHAHEQAELVKEAKAQLTTSRKELKAVLTLQTARLYEAMCAGRTWAAADWSQYLAAHPLVGPLVSRLVWLENPGPAQRAFRPAEDGALLDVHDEPVDLAPGARIGVAHRVTVGDDASEAWRTHLDDYGVTPLFDQFSHTPPKVPGDAHEVRDLEGHLTDTFSFRNVATKRGYTRGAGEDGGCFYEYSKPFTTTGLVAVLQFTGSWVPEENRVCATKTLAFRRGRRSVPLSEVPDILLAECYADYAALAALGPFNPDWERKAGL